MRIENLEIVKTMTNEEFADFMATNIVGKQCVAMYQTSYNAWLEWSKNTEFDN